jgi:translation initiation factor 2 gamma subunit (eIF-2gamma)
MKVGMLRRVIAVVINKIDTIADHELRFMYNEISTFVRKFLDLEETTPIIPMSSTQSILRGNFLEIILEILLQLCSRRSQIVCYRVAIVSPI